MESASETGQRRILDTLDEGVLVLDEGGALCDWNAAALRMLGLTSEQLLDRTIRDANWRLTAEEPAPPRSTEDPLMTAFASARRHGHTTIVVRAAAETLSRISVRNHHSVRDERGAPNAEVFTLVDVTAQHAIEVENAHYREIIDTLDASHRILEESPVGICAVDIDGTVLRHNMAFLALAGFEATSIFALVHDEDAATLREAFTWLIAGRAPSVRIETRVASPSGERAWCEITAVAMHQGQSDSAILLLLNDVTERRKRETRLRQLAERDPLTGVHNRRSLIHALRERLRSLPLASARPQSDAALLLIDLDGFKSVNDTHGHAVGDAVLGAVAAGIRDRTRVADVVGRLGGDEFALLLDLHDSADVAAIAEDIIVRIEEAARGVVPLPRITASIGIVHLQPGVDADEALDLADRAMYAAKRAGKGRAVESSALLSRARPTSP